MDEKVGLYCRLSMDDGTFGEFKASKLALSIPNSKNDFRKVL